MLQNQNCNVMKIKQHLFTKKNIIIVFIFRDIFIFKLKYIGSLIKTNRLIFP